MVYSRVAAQLDSDPTAIRKVFLLRDLEDRALNSPRATVGMLDVVETIAPDSHSILDYKEDLVLRAIDGLCSTGNATDAIQALRLISERLARPSFKQVSSSVLSQMIAATADRTLQDPELALQSCEAFFYQDADTNSPGAAFVRGVLTGLARLGAATPSKLAILRHFPNAAPAVIAREPVIAASYVRAIGRKDVGTEAASDLISWINALDEPNARNKLREALLPELKDDEHAAVLAALLKDISSQKTPHVLDILYRSTRGFKPEAVRRVVEEHISRAHPVEVCDWARTSAWRSNGAASIIAASYPSNREGLHELLCSGIEGRRRQSQVVANFLRQVAPTQYPDWFQDEAREDPEFLVQLLGAGAQTTTRVAREIARVLNDVQEIAVGKALPLADEIETFAKFPFYDRLVECAMRNVVAGVVTRRISWNECSIWQQAPCASVWFGSVPKWMLKSCLTSGSYCGSDSFICGWQWLSSAPRSLYERRPSILPDLIEGLISVQGPHWGEAAVERWIAVVNRSCNESPARTCLALCAQGLKYGFSHRQYPLSRLVVATFYEVYGAVAGESSTPPETSGLFGAFDWDKAKELRRELVECYYQSDWPPGDLALAAREIALLRKVFRRVYRKWRGSRYVESMLADLSQRSDPTVMGLRDQLAELMRNPDFYEEWD
ncbi:MAG: hypothetical protein ABFC96_01590 [Thermoguttaceae bacterium]